MSPDLEHGYDDAIRNAERRRKERERGGGRKGESRESTGEGPGHDLWLCVILKNLFLYCRLHRMFGAYI